MRSKCAGTHRHGCVDASNGIDKREQTETCARQAMEEQLREDQQELIMREQKKEAKDAKKIRGIVHKGDRSKGTSHVQDEMEKLMHHDEHELLRVLGGWHWGDNKGGWLDPELCAKARREEVECLSETERAPIKTVWAEICKGRPGKPKVCARCVAKECKTFARPELYASTPPLEVLKVVLSEIATV